MYDCMSKRQLQMSRRNGSVKMQSRKPKFMRMIWLPLTDHAETQTRMHTQTNDEQCLRRVPFLFQLLSAIGYVLMWP